MADTARQMTADDFLEWCLAPERDEERWEFVDGIPVQMMAGTTDRHDQIVVNLIVALGVRLKGGPCAPRTADQAVKTHANRRVRRPDVIVDCGPRPPKGLFTPTPTAVFEVLSPSTTNLTFSTKIDEYKGLGSMRHIVIVDQERMLVIHHARAANDTWTEEELTAADEILKLSAIGADTPLSEIYEGVIFDA